MPHGPRLLARRTALAVGVAGVLALAACDDDDPRAGGESSNSGSDPDSDPDSALVERVQRELREAQHLASGAGMLELATLHRAHLQALDGDPARGRARHGSVDREAVLTHERALQEQLMEAAIDADSGALARLLASMSAAIAQRLALPGGAP